MRSHGVDWYHHLPAHVKGILDTLAKAGHEAYIVGGSVRDLWLGITPKDFDVASSATPDEIEKLFPRTEGVGRQFGIMIVVTESGPVEVARFRADAEYKNGRHPTTVTFSSPEEDAKRRDFTINGLFYDVAKRQIIDYVGGLEDLEKKIIRCVGDASQRFQEDSLRMLRAVRFHSQLAKLGFKLDSILLDEVRACATRISLVSRERVTQEVERVFLSSSPSVGLLDMIATNLWTPVFQSSPPSLTQLTNFDVIGEIYTWLAAAKPQSALFFSAAATWIPGFDAEKVFVLTREVKAALQKTPSQIERLQRYVSLERADKKILLGEPTTLDAVAILRATAEEELLDTLDEAMADRDRWAQRGALNPPPFLGGNDLLQLGLKPGPAVKELLDKVRRAQLNEEVANPESALALAKSLLPN